MGCGPARIHPYLFITSSNSYWRNHLPQHSRSQSGLFLILEWALPPFPLAPWRTPLSQLPQDPSFSCGPPPCPMGPLLKHPTTGTGGLYIHPLVSSSQPES